MSKQKSKREAPKNGFFSAHEVWLHNLSRRQLVCYRVLQLLATVLLALLVILILLVRNWIKVPEVPVVDPTLGGDQSAVSTDPSFEGARMPDVAFSGRKDGVYTFLVIGKDTGGGGNTDTILLLSYNINEKTLYGLNLPRDIMVNVSSTSKRLNAVYNVNKGKDKDKQVARGIAALKTEVMHLTGILPDFYVIAEWEAIGALVDALGGVEFEVPFDMDYDDPTPNQNLHIHQAAGLRVLTGEDAMQVIRHRKNNDGSHSNGDIGRLKIQQDFLMAAAKECLKPSTFLKVPALANIFTENVTTDLTIGNILAFAQLAYGMDADENIAFFTPDLAASFSYRGAAMITLKESTLLVLLNEYFNPYLRDLTSSDLQLVFRKSDGSFGVTNAALADKRMGEKPAPAKPAPTPDQPMPPPIDENKLDGDVDDEETDADTSQAGDTSQNTDSPQSGDGSQNTDTSQNGYEGNAHETAPTQDNSGASQSDSSATTQSPIDIQDILAVDPAQILPDPRAAAQPAH